MKRIARIPWLKLAVFGLLAWFVATRIDFDDQLLVRPAEEGGPAEWELRLASGETIPLVDGESVSVRVLSADDRTVELWVVSAGERATVEAALLEETGPLSVRPGLRGSLRGLSSTRLSLAFLLFAPVPLLLAWRWLLLLRAAGIRMGLGSALRLTWIGLFFNLVVPGGVGGDLVKLYEVGRHTQDRATALSTMLADRVIGLLVLIALGVSAAVFAGAGGTTIVETALLLGAALAVGLAVYGSTTFRRRFDVRRWLGKLPMREQLLKLDEAVLAMRAAPLALLGATAISAVAQACSIGSTLMVAHAVGLVSVRLVQMLEIVPVALMANAIPLSPGGLGQLEVAFQELMHRYGLASPAEGFAVGLLVRIVTAGWSLPGLALWFAGNRGRDAREVPRALEPGVR